MEGLIHPKLLEYLASDDYHGFSMGEGCLPEFLLDRHVPLIDEVAEFIQRSAWPSLDSILDDLFERIALQPGLTEGERRAAEQDGIVHETIQYRARYVQAAADALRQHKAANPNTFVTKLSYSAADRGFLDALDLKIDQLHRCRHVSSLALLASQDLSPDALRNLARGAFIAGAHHSIIAMYAGPYRPCLDGPGFYLIFDCRAYTLAAAPQLPRHISMFSHRCIGSGAAVLHITGGAYIIAELLLRLGSKWLPTSSATLVTWSNCPNLSRWMEREVQLPQLPVQTDEAYGYAFHADTVFAAGASSLCWVDLLLGIIVCKDLLAQALEFSFIPLPEGFSSADPFQGGRGTPKSHRCMACSTVDSTTIWFISIDNLMLTRWKLNLSDPKSEWIKVASICIPSSYAVVSEGGSLPEVKFSYPLLSITEEGVIYMDLDIIRNKMPPRRFHIALHHDNLLMLVPDSGGAVDKIVTYPFSLAPSVSDVVGCFNVAPSNVAPSRCYYP